MMYVMDHALVFLALAKTIIVVDLGQDLGSFIFCSLQISPPFCTSEENHSWHHILQSRSNIISLDPVLRLHQKLLSIILYSLLFFIKVTTKL